MHLDFCPNMPQITKMQLANMKASTTISSIQRKYYMLAAKGLGLADTQHGIRAGSDSVPVVSQAVFSFSLEQDTSPRHQLGETPRSSDRKRELEEEDDSLVDSKPSPKRPTPDTGSRDDAPSSKAAL
jgi:hypothetical protein